MVFLIIFLSLFNMQMVKKKGLFSPDNVMLKYISTWGKCLLSFGSYPKYVSLLKGIYPEFQVIRGFSQKIPAGLLSYDQIHS